MSIPEKKPAPLSLEDELRALLEEGRIYEAMKLLLDGIGRHRNVELLGDALQERHRPRRFLLCQEVDLEIEVRPALALPAEAVLADQDEDREKDRLE